MTDSLSTAQIPPDEKGGWSAKRIAIVSVLALVGVVVLIFVIGLILAILDVERAGLIVQLLRDFLFIVLILESILIGFAFVVLIAQIARSINLVESEARPILENTQDAVNSAKGTVEFVSKNATGPIIRLLSFFAGLRIFLREFGGIRRAIRPRKDGDNPK